jgi:prepilin-type N-terminal cleavage/methylation domain-containing protein
MREIKTNASGFTLIELMVTMLIAVVVLGGMSSLFVSQTRTAQMLNQKSEVMNDLFLVSQIMQAQMRGAKAICWNNASKWLGYQPLNSTANITAACPASSMNTPNGGFRFKPKNLPLGKPSPYICWRRPILGGNTTRCQELARGLTPAIGLTVTGPAGPNSLNASKTVTLTAQYLDRERHSRDMTLSFKIWPRNKQ